MSARRRLTAAAIAAGTAITAAYLLLGPGAEETTQNGRSNATATGEAPPTAHEPASPGEARLLAELEGERHGYATLRTSFASAGKRSSASERRVLAALHATSADHAWVATCRAELCRIVANGPPAEWQRTVREAPAVRAMAQSIAVDPDGADAAVYAVLAPVNAARGHDLLTEIGTELERSGDARYCLTGVGATGAIDYELSVDASGYSYRSSTDLPRSVVECVNEVLGEILRQAPVPPQGATLASRSFGLRR